MNTIINFSVRHCYLVLFLVAVLGVVGAGSYKQLIIDAVPDITNVQVQINTVAPGYSPYEVEQRITAPVELLLSGIPGLDYTRSLSRYGLSQVTVAFHDGTDIYFARQLLSQRLQESRDRLPTGLTPTMGPIATGLGEIYMFTVENSPGTASNRTLQELREVQDWIVKPQLRTVPGVVEINSIGGASKQVVITPRIEELKARGLTLEDLSVAIAKNNSNVGAGFIEQGGEQFLIRVPAQATSTNDLNNVVVSLHDGQPILLSQVAEVGVGAELRTGAATENGEEVVLGTVLMLIGENGRDVSDRVAAKIAEISSSLPDGVRIKTVYNRSNLVNATIRTVKRNLFEGAILVIAVLFAALGSVRAALITAAVIPLAMLLTIFGMTHSRLSANLMSLGALDFGLIVDGAVILVENCVRRIVELQKRLGRALNEGERRQLVYEASIEVREATMFGELIIMIVYVPILALSGIEGKMYHPMALTVLLALGAAFVLSLTFVPAAVAVFLRGEIKERHGYIDRLQSGYRQLLQRLLHIPQQLIIGAALLFLLSLGLFFRLGSEFMPSLDEGDIALHALRIPGTSLTQAVSMQHQLEHAIQQVPEVAHAFSKIGTAEIANDPMPPSVADGFVMLKPRSEWTDQKKPKQQVVAEIERIVREIPGNNYEFTQPIQMRFNELIAGVRSDVAVKIFGDDMALLQANAATVKKILDQIPGASDVKIEQVVGLPTVTISPDRVKIARLGLNAADIQEIISTAYAGEEVSRFYEGDKSFPIVVRLSESDRKRVDMIAKLPIPLEQEETMERHSLETERTALSVSAPGRPFVALGDIAAIAVAEGPNQLSRENGKRRIVVTANVRDRDLGSFVEEAQMKIAAGSALPPGYWRSWGGQYENLISAKKRLEIIVPLVLLSVFGLIYFTFRSVLYSVFIFSGVPFALTGGIFALWIRGIPFSISAAVGFIALSGVSVLNGLVLVSFTRRLIESGADILSSIIEGAVSRLRPVLMTALVASLGFLPMAISQGTGSEVQRPLATVVIGGIVSSTALTLIVLPALMLLVLKRRRASGQ